MEQSVTVTSTTSDGDDVTITISATGADSGTIRAVTTKNGQGVTTKIDTIKLTQVRRSAGGNAISCRAKAAGLDLDVHCTLKAANGHHAPSVAIVAKALILKLLDESYPLDPGEYEAIRSFLTNANFPKG